MADNEYLGLTEDPEESARLAQIRSLAATAAATAADPAHEDEETEVILVDTIHEVKLGRQAENDTQNVRIDCSAWLTQLPGCTLMIVAKRPGENVVYVPNVTVSSGVITWPILTQDVAHAGCGRAEVRAIKNGKIKKSRMFRTHIITSLAADGTPDAPEAPDWAKTIAEAVDNSAASAAASASAAQGAETSAASAAASATEAAASAERAAQAAARVYVPSVVGPRLVFTPSTEQE